MLNAENQATFAATVRNTRPSGRPRLAPFHSANNGCIDFVLSPEDIAQEIVRIARLTPLRKQSGI
jgi:hypothetical protein